MIQKLELNNFTAFKRLEIDYSPKINVIIGENGTGKTHLLKAGYVLCLGNHLIKKKTENGNDKIEDEITKNLVRIFMPLDDKLGKICRYGFGTTESAKVESKFASGENLAISFRVNSKSVGFKNTQFNINSKEDPVFIPTKEVISFMLGFVSLYEKFGVSFDRTYQDICLFLDLPKLRQENLHEKSKWAMGELEKICGGRFIFYGGGKVTFKAGNAEYSANSIAEGFRKAGMLSRLLETGAIQPGISGPLFWDEPEANMNPKLMKLFVEILLELSRNGQQVILATHDYVLLKWFDLLMDKGKEDHVRFHALYRDIESKEIKVESTDDYNQIKRDPILDTYAEIYDEDVKRALGGPEI